MSVPGFAVIESMTATILFFRCAGSSVWPGESGGTSVNAVPAAECACLNSRSFVRKMSTICACVSGKS